MFLYPVDSILPAIAQSLARNRSVVLQAPPGSGKTTRVAPFLMHAPWLEGRRMLLLEPRRLAARAAAAFMAQQLNQAVGDSIGYHIRLERKVSARTCVEILTEGLLTQRLLHDPELRNVGAIIFDEFHERSLAADTGLAMALDARRALRPDLRLVVMSATLDPAAIANHLGDADIHLAAARLFPVETRLLPRLATAPIPQQVANAIMRALANETGSILAFLPGEGEIRRAHELLTNRELPPDVSLHPLYGALPRTQQEEAVMPPAPGRRKVVLATSIAETSLTIEGISVVVDCGWMRLPRFSPRNGMSRLETLRITRDRADQRRGRAGRTCPGVCYRLWDEPTDRQLAAAAAPEIMDADLAPTVLQSAEWGSAARTSLPWLTEPPDAAWRQATELLQKLDALNAAEQITARGRSMAKLAAHPRLAHMILQAASLGSAQRACLLAAAISETGSDSAARFETDMQRLSERVTEGRNDSFAVRVRELARRWARDFPPADKRRLSDGLMLAWAFPDRIARRRAASGQFLLRNGRGACIDTADPLAGEVWLVAVELQDDGAQATIRLAAPITMEEIEKHFAAHFTHQTITAWDRRVEAVIAVKRLALGAITIREGGQAAPDAKAVVEALLEGVQQKGIDQLPWQKNALTLRARVNFLHRILPEQGWPDLSNTRLLESLPEWLGPWCQGLMLWSHLQNLNLHDILLAHLHSLHLTHRQLDELAPLHMPVPSGSQIRVRYDEDTPYMEVRIQEVFGMLRTPVIANGRTPVVMRLLSPAQRPVQVTRDLASFWQNGYALVRKELRGRYPKHYWPEDPLQATPTHRVRPQ